MIEPIDLQEFGNTNGDFSTSRIGWAAATKLNELIEAHNKLEAEYKSHTHDVNVSGHPILEQFTTETTPPVESQL